MPNGPRVRSRAAPFWQAYGRPRPVEAGEPAARIGAPIEPADRVVSSLRGRSRAGRAEGVGAWPCLARSRCVSACRAAGCGRLVPLDLVRKPILRGGQIPGRMVGPRLQDRRVRVSSRRAEPTVNRSVRPITSAAQREGRPNPVILDTDRPMEATCDYGNSSRESGRRTTVHCR